MEGKFRGVCMKCGLAHSEDPDVHADGCTEDKIRLMEIDREVGPRAVREALIALGHKGFNNKVETLENEAKAIRARKTS